MVNTNCLKGFNFATYLLLFLFSIQIGFFIWAVNKGFDFTDEAFSFLGFKNPEEIYKVATYYTIIYDRFFGWIDLSIVTLRVIRLLLLLICGALLAHGLIKWLIRKQAVDFTHQVNLFLFILIGSLLVSANGSQSFTYNMMGNFLLQLIVGVFLYTFQRQAGINRFDLICFSILGALLFMLFAVKFSSAILISFVIVIMLVYDKRNVKIVATYLGFLAIGTLFMGLFLFWTYFPSWLLDYKTTLTLLSNISSASIWSRYLEDYHFTTSSKLIANGWVVIATIVLLFANRIQNKWVKLAIAFVINGLIAYVAYKADYYLGGPKYYYVYTGLYILLIVVLLFSQTVFLVTDLIRRKNQNNIFIVALFLLSIPFCGAIGTSNLLSIQIIWYTSFLFAALYLLLYLNNGYVLGMMIVVLAINAVAQSVSGIVYYPYRIDKTLYEESHRLPKGVSSERVLLNASIKESIENVHSLVYSKTNFSKGDPIFSFSPDYYGFIYLLDGVLPGWGWYDEKGTTYNCFTLKNTKVKNLDRMLLFVPTYYAMDSVYQQCFAEMKINFSDDYAKVGDVTYFMGSLDRSLTIYAPKTILKE